MEKLLISDEGREYFPRAPDPVGRSHPDPNRKRETLQQEIERKTAEFLADGGEVEIVQKGISTWEPTIQIVINADADRRREKKRKKQKSAR